MTSDDIRVDASRRELLIKRGDKWLRREGMTVRELQLLERLVHRRGTVVDRAELIEAVWGDRESVRPGVVDKHVAALRKKLGALGRRIHSVYGVGYKLA